MHTKLMRENYFLNFYFAESCSLFWRVFLVVSGPYALNAELTEREGLAWKINGNLYKLSSLKRIQWKGLQLYIDFMLPTSLICANQKH